MNGMIDTGTAQLLRQYTSLQSTLVGLYAQAVNDQAPTAPATRSRFLSECLQAQLSFLTAANASLMQVADTLVRDALDTAGLGTDGAHLAEIRQIVSESLMLVLSTLSGATQRDVDLVAKGLREFALKVDHKMNAAGMSYAAAVIKTRIEQTGLFSFKQVDRANRKWNSADYVKHAVRGFLLSVWVETFLFAVSRMGEDLARVKCDNEHNGMVFSISGMTPGCPKFDDIKGDIWHPNSTARVERIAA